MNIDSRVIALTMGDPRGIGPEIIVKLYRDHAEEMRGTIVLGDAAVFTEASRQVGIDAYGSLPVAVYNSLASFEERRNNQSRCLPLLQTVEQQSCESKRQLASLNDETDTFIFSEPPDDMGGVKENATRNEVRTMLAQQGASAPQTGSSGEILAGRAAAACIVWGARAALAGQVRALVTAPVNKAALAAAGIRYPGHTELLQAEAAGFLGRSVGAVPVRMMLANSELRVVLVSIHISLAQAIAAVTFNQVLETIQIAHASLIPVLGRLPRIAVAGLNPHAGEGGLMGCEEVQIIAPAVCAAKNSGLQVSGPFAPDTVFMRARTGEFDCVVAMYHDQGLIPVKYMGLDEGVNVTLGLPLVRTSPDHGTAFDIAGLGRADPRSMLAALRMARKLCP